MEARVLVMHHTLDLDIHQVHFDINDSWQDDRITYNYGGHREQDTQGIESFRYILDLFNNKSSRLIYKRWIKCYLNSDTFNIIKDLVLELNNPDVYFIEKDLTKTDK